MPWESLWTPPPARRTASTWVCIWQPWYFLFFNERTVKHTISSSAGNFLLFQSQQHNNLTYNFICQSQVSALNLCLILPNVIIEWCILPIALTSLKHCTSGKENWEIWSFHWKMRCWDSYKKYISYFSLLFYVHSEPFVFAWASRILVGHTLT